MQEKLKKVLFFISIFAKKCEKVPFWSKSQLRQLEKCEGAILHFGAKIAPNSTILAKLHLTKIHYNFTLLSQNCTFYQKSQFYERKSHFFPALFQKFSRFWSNSS